MSVAVLQVLIGLALRSVGRIANTALGWATALLFGRVPSRQQIIVTAMTFGSVVWLVAATGIAWPAFAIFLLAFVTLPPWIDPAWIRLAMLASAIAVPLVVGAAALLLMDPAHRPRGAANVARALLPGYRYTLGMAVTLIVTAMIAPVTRIRTLMRRWTTRHLPAVIHAAHYDAVVDEIAQALDNAGVGTRRVQTSPLLEIPIRMLVLLIGGTVAGMARHDLATLAARDVEVIVHPFDIVINGHIRRVTSVQAILTEALPFTPAYLTWTREAHEIEDRLREAWRNATATPGGATVVSARALDDIEHSIRHIGVAFDEWEILFHEFLLVERRLRSSAFPRAGDPNFATPGDPRRAFLSSRSTQAGALS